MAKEDEEKTSFITLSGTFYYVRMAFGLNNTGATFAKLVYNALANQIGRNIKVYVDDIVVKSILAHAHAAYLHETLDNLPRAGMKLNLEKCALGVQAGKLLSFLVSKRGIEANPAKIHLVLEMCPP